MTNNSLPDRPIPEGAVLIPDTAQRVFHGVIFDVYQWQQEMFDGSFETFEMLRRPDTVLIIAEDDDGEILACNEEQPGGIVRKEHLPAGRVDASDKTILAAAKRELREETGYSFAEWRLLDVVQPEKKIEWFVYTFVARSEVGIDEVQLDSGEKIELTTVSLETLRETSLKWIPSLKSAETFDELFSHATI
jgi:ADP-ribose pyrophosphatase